MALILPSVICGPGERIIHAVAAMLPVDREDFVRSGAGLTRQALMNACATTNLMAQSKIEAV